MRTLCQIVVSIHAALAAATSLSCPPAATVTVTLWVDIHNPSSSAIPITSAPQTCSTAAPDDSGNYMTIAITNLYGSQLSLSFGSNVGAPTPVGNPSATILPDNSPTQYTFPTGWAGRIGVGSNLNINGSKIEGSFTEPPDIDVSYVDGYSVPITCSSEGTAVSGCNIELFTQSGIECYNQVDGPVCINTAQNSNSSYGSTQHSNSYHGSAQNSSSPYESARNSSCPYDFFAACAGAAYTYPEDDKANVSNLKSNLVSCCIGTSCTAFSQQLPKQEYPLHKEPIQIEVIEPKGKRKKATSPSLLPFAHKRRQHHHWPPSRIHR